MCRSWLFVGTAGNFNDSESVPKDWGGTKGKKVIHTAGEKGDKKYVKGGKR
jgi:hypothetical protein